MCKSLYSGQQRRIWLTTTAYGYGGGGGGNDGGGFMGGSQGGSQDGNTKV